ncbi:hypothetical protein Scep_017717 [Stephania cephalantha]|uniref:HMA domain-containing protein n=1 Tax=Stephania cephalantha TaxID=152367 RepID=A0AAP0IPY9_9MAGN
MAAIAAGATIRPNTCHARPASSSSSSSSPTRSLALLGFPRPSLRSNRSTARSFMPNINYKFHHQTSRTIRVRALAEEAVAPEGGEQKTEEASEGEQPVSVLVSPSDVLTMFFQADGAMDESAIPRVTKALEEIEGVSDLKVKVLEGIASVELAKQTTVQATGVASNLVEVIQGSGFKLQTLNLSFQDEEDIIN